MHLIGQHHYYQERAPPVDPEIVQLALVVRSSIYAQHSTVKLTSDP